jgi:hypothetical protein
MKNKGMYLGIIAVFWMTLIAGVSARQAEYEPVTTMDQPDRNHFSKDRRQQRHSDHGPGLKWRLL